MVDNGEVTGEAADDLTGIVSELVALAQKSVERPEVVALAGILGLAYKYRGSVLGVVSRVSGRKGWR